MPFDKATQDENKLFQFALRAYENRRNLLARMFRLLTMVPRFFFVPVPSSRRTGALKAFHWGHSELSYVAHWYGKKIIPQPLPIDLGVSAHPSWASMELKDKKINEMVFVLWNFAGDESNPRRSFSLSLQNHQKLHSSTAVSINISERRGRALVPKAELKQHKNVALCKCCLSTLCVSQRREIFFSSQVSSFFPALTLKLVGVFHTENW